MSGFTRGREGGYIVTTAEGSAAYQLSVDEETLRKIAEALGISETVREHISKAKSIYIYRGSKPPPSGGDQS
jgi:hypothetical protein